jgi:pantothenate kinase
LDPILKSFFSSEEMTALFQQIPQGKIDTLLLSLERVHNMQKEQREHEEQRAKQEEQREHEGQREKLIAAVRRAAPEGKITCAQATQLADEHQFPRREMGSLLDELKVKIRDCQLGCF